MDIRETIKIIVADILGRDPKNLNVIAFQKSVGTASSEKSLIDDGTDLTNTKKEVYFYGNFYVNLKMSSTTPDSFRTRRDNSDEITQSGNVNVGYSGIDVMPLEFPNVLCSGAGLTNGAASVRSRMTFIGWRIQING